MWIRVCVCVYTCNRRYTLSRKKQGSIVCGEIVWPTKIISPGSFNEKEKLAHCYLLTFRKRKPHHFWLISEKCVRAWEVVMVLLVVKEMRWTHPLRLLSTCTANPFFLYEIYIFIYIYVLTYLVTYRTKKVRYLRIFPHTHTPNGWHCRPHTLNIWR